MQHNLEKTLSMKLILCIFEELSGLKIKFHKSEVFCFSISKEVREDYINLFGCEAGSSPFRYLGKLLSYGERLVLINSVLTSLPIFVLSKYPKGCRKG
jgi:hypothetical protein